MKIAKLVCYIGLSMILVAGVGLVFLAFLDSAAKGFFAMIVYGIVIVFMMIFTQLFEAEGSL